MIILSVDPGYDRCGIAIIEAGNPSKIVYSDCLTSTKNDTHEIRLADIYKKLEALVDKYHPEALALETIFFSINKKTAIKVAESRGIALLLAGIKKLKLVELSPQEVKLSMTGIGNASKDQVQKMVSLSLKIDTSKKIDDEIDAIALGIASAQKLHVENLENGLAK